MKKAISVVLMLIMVFSLLPMMAVRDAAAATELKVTGGSYYYDGHEKTVTAEIKDGTGYTIQYSYYTVNAKGTWVEEAPKLVDPGSVVVYVRAVKGTEILSHDPVLLEVVGDAPAGSMVKIIASGSIVKAPVYKSASTTSEKLGEFDAGEVCTLVSQEGKWFELSNGAITGFVYFEFVKITSRPNGEGGGAPDITKVEINAYGGTYLYDGAEHKVKASMVHGDGFVLEFSTDNGKTWTTIAPGLTAPGRLTVKIQATSSVGIKTHPDVVLQILSSLPSGTKVKIKAHGSTTTAPVRKTPSNSGTKVGTVKEKDEVDFLAKEGDWIKIANGVMEGYVYYWFVDLDNIEIKPTITVQPENTWVMVNEDAVFTVIASGTGTLGYRWQVFEAGSWKDVASGGTSPSYSFKATAADDGKRVRCIVTDSNGKTTSDEAKLTVVTTAPIIDRQPQDSGNAVGKNAVFTVVSTGAKSHQWYYQKPSTTEWFPVEEESGRTAVLSVKVTEDNNGYKFKCKLENSIGSTETSAATLKIVTAKPKITVQPTKTTVTEGSNAVFTVAATGDGLNIQWQRKMKGGKWEDAPGASAKTLVYNEPTTYAMNGASYRCVIQNAKGKVTSKSVKLTVKGIKATITTHPASISVANGAAATFTVAATGTGKVTFQWECLKPGATKWKKCSGATAATYTFKATTKLNGAKYRCKVTNNGTATYSNEATLTVY